MRLNLWSHKCVRLCRLVGRTEAERGFHPSKMFFHAVLQYNVHWEQKNFNDNKNYSMKITKGGCTVTFSLFTTGFTWTLCMLFQDLHRLLLWWNTSGSFPTKTRKVQQLLQERNIKSGVKALYSMAWTNLKRGIQRLKGLQEEDNLQWRYPGDHQLVNSTF